MDSLVINSYCPEPDLIAHAAALARQKAPLIFPTDTVYGVGVAVVPGASPQPLFALKGRTRDKAIAWLVADVCALDIYGDEVPTYAFALARAHWPGALTLVVRAKATVPEAFRAPDGSIALRAPSHPIPLALLKALGVPLATTSANLQGEEPATSFSSLDERLIERLIARLDAQQEPQHAAPPPNHPLALGIDGGPTPGSLPSTVISCLEEHPRVIREGALSRALLLH